MQAIRRLRRYLEELEAACILKARELGASPSDIGEALGISRQAVYNHLHQLEERARTDPNFVIPDLGAADALDANGSPEMTTSPAIRAVKARTERKTTIGHD